MSDVTVLLTPRRWGGHETALLGWLQDAVQHEGLAPAIVGTDAALAAACEHHGLARHLQRHAPLQALAKAPRGTPLLLAPGVLHAQAWLLAAALLRRHAVWVYVPMAYRAVRMGYRHGALRDALLAPLLRRVHGWITISDAQRTLLHEAWGLGAPVHVLPNRLPALPAAAVRPAAAGAPLRVAFVGRFDAWQKGLDWIAAGLRAGAPWAAGCVWHFQGAGAAEPLLLELASALGPQRVQVHHHAPVAHICAHADVLLLPSRYEGLPLVALEATALGLPVLASREAGLHELLPPASCFAFGDDAALAQALRQLQAPAARAAALAFARARLPALLQHERYAATLHTLAQGWRVRR